MRALFQLLAIASLALPLPAQTANYTFYGQPCATVTVPFSAVGVPRLGTVFKIRLRSTATNPNEFVNSLLFTGSSNRTLGQLPLPVSMTWYQGRSGLNRWTSCGKLYTSSEFVTIVPQKRTGPLTYDVPFPIPNDKRLLGIRFYQQPLLVQTFTLKLLTTYSWGRIGVGTIGT